MTDSTADSGFEQVDAALPFASAALREARAIEKDPAAKPDITVVFAQQPGPRLASGPRDVVHSELLGGV